MTCIRSLMDGQMPDDEELHVVDSNHITDADWAEIYKLMRFYANMVREQCMYSPSRQF